MVRLRAYIMMRLKFNSNNHKQRARKRETGRGLCMHRLPAERIDTSRVARASRLGADVKADAQSAIASVREFIAVIIGARRI